METKNVYALMLLDDTDISIVMVFDDRENAEMYKQQLDIENEGCGYFYYIENTKAIMTML